MRIFTAIAISFGMLAAGARSQTFREQEAIRITRSGSQPAQPVPADNFTGAARIGSSFQTAAPARLSGAQVTFEPGARTAWHTHPLGQTLIVTAGTGRVQRWGDPVDEIRQGDVVWIPPGQKHWHGAAPNSSMTHIAIVEQLDGKTVEWMEKVSDAQYGAPLGGKAESTGAGAQPRPSQAAIGDFAPKLAELTDKVLYGDIWERPELSKPGDRGGAGRFESSGPTPVASSHRERKRSHAAGVDRDHHSPGVLCRLAKRRERNWRREGSFRAEMKRE
jgi:4-carboxymuconolactone decarboxylase